MALSDWLTLAAAGVSCAAVALTAYGQLWRARRAERRFVAAAIAAAEREWGAARQPKTPSPDRQIAQQWEREYQLVTGEPYPGA